MSYIYGNVAAKLTYLKSVQLAKNKTNVTATRRDSRIGRCRIKLHSTYWANLVRTDWEKFNLVSWKFNLTYKMKSCPRLI